MNVNEMKEKKNGNIENNWKKNVFEKIKKKYV